MPKCSKCGDTNPDNFWKASSKSNGYQCECKPCHIKRKRRPESIAQARLYYKDNQKKIIKQRAKQRQKIKMKFLPE